VARKINIAIDGYSSCGKSTLAKQLAKRFKYIYIDTGAMYRAVTLYALRNNLVHDGELDVEALKETLSGINISFTYNRTTGTSETFLNGENVEREIRTLQVARLVSPVAAIRDVRQKLVKLQQKLGRERGVVMDGRDIGTVVLPDAELKIFMTASNEIRAQRRFLELKERGDEITMEEVRKNLADRDHIDTTRKDDPLRRADDAIILNNGHLTLEEQYEIVSGWVEDRIRLKKATTH
jgi:cytidylate kinase